MVDATTCWARITGGCSSKMSKEHVFTKSLFDKRVQVKALNVPLTDTTPRWLRSQQFDIPIRNCYANILCEAHNNILGRGPDRAAKQVMRAMLRFREPLKYPGSDILRPPKPVQICGVTYGQWLCKTHCNIMAAAGVKPEDIFVFYAFGRHIERKLYFYMPAHVRLSPSIAKGHVHYEQFCDTAGATVAFTIALAGLTTLVSTIAIDELAREIVEFSMINWIERISYIQMRTALGTYEILFNW